MVFIILTVSVLCSKKDKIIKIVPGYSISKVKLGMTEQQLISVLGRPNNQLSKEEMNKFGVYDVMKDGEYKNSPLDNTDNINVFVYQNPPLTIIINISMITSQDF